MGVYTTGVATFRAEGLGGDDTFTLVPPIPSSPYSTPYLNGGAQASATGDHANLKGTTLNDMIAVSGQQVILSGVTVNGNGLESFNLDSGAGTDLLTYTGMPGVTESINVAGSTTPGSGQVPSGNFHR